MNVKEMIPIMVRKSLPSLRVITVISGKGTAVRLSARYRNVIEI
jgi:hypothetical protein